MKIIVIVITVIIGIVMSCHAVILSRYCGFFRDPNPTEMSFCVFIVQIFRNLEYFSMYFFSVSCIMYSFDLIEFAFIGVFGPFVCVRWCAPGGGGINHRYPFQSDALSECAFVGVLGI